MSYETIARRWALAIFDIGKETGEIARLNTDLAAFATAYTSNAELSLVLDNPLVPEAGREAVVVEIAEKMGLAEVSRSALRLLVRKRRLVALPDIVRRLGTLSDDDQNTVRAEVQSAGPLSADYLAKLRAELEKATGHKVVVSHQQDPALIGGVVTKIGDRVIDGSVRARLKSFRESLLR
jgi:F-type H+-transporting ATPase subunit delta